MKLRFWICLLAMAVALPVTGVACSSEGKRDVVEPPKVSSPDEKLVTYTVTGMTCEGCEGHVRTELAKLPNVTKAVASHKEKKAWMIVKGDAPSRDAVEKAIKAAGDTYALGDQG